MAIFKCESCGYERDVPDKLLGKKAKCPDCGHGVTIVDQLLVEDESFEAVFEDADMAEYEEDYDSSGQNDDESSGPIDLDDEDTEIDFETGDVVCSGCGHVMGEDQAAVCPECGGIVERPHSFPELDEDDVDVSDLADDDVRQVWDADYSGNEGQTEAAIDAVEVVDGWRLFEGSFPLNIYAGIVSGALAFFFAVAMSLLASSQQGVYVLLPYILGTALTGMVVGSIFFSFQTRIPFALAGPESTVTVVLFLLIGGIYRSMVNDYSVEFILPTILAAIVTTSFVAGGGLWLLGKLKAGEYVRYIPIHILGGVIGGVGVFVLFGSVDWMGQLALDWNNLYSAVNSFILNIHSDAFLDIIVPSIAFGVILFLATAWIRNSLFMLALILVASGVGYAAGLWGADMNISSLASPIPFPEAGVMIHPSEVFKSGLYSNIQWGIIKSNGLYMGAVVVLIMLTVMYRITTLEMIMGRESELNDEYRALGLTNMVSGLCGGMPSSLSYERSAGNHASGARGPIAGIMAGLICGVGLFYADVVLPMIPRFVPEGLLIYAGLDLIRSWLFKTKTTFTRRDDIWMLWITFLATVLFGVLEGIGLGVGLALMVTVSRYSRDGAVRNVLSGSNHRSNVDRASAQQRILKEFGDHIHILRLQGFLFLGSMERLLKDIRIRLDDRDKLPVKYLILDFKLVTGLASAAGLGLDKLHNLVADYELELIITNAPFELEEHLEQSGHVGEGEGLFKAFFNLDYALEWCENHVLDSENMLKMKQLTLPQLLAPVFPEPKYIPALMKVLKREVADKGEAVFRQGDKSDSMYFVESGKLDVELELEGGKILRLKKVGPGAVFGEMGIYTLAPRSATIRAAEKCVLYKMTIEKLDAVEKRAPVLVTAINRFLINMLSERLGDANAKVRDLML
ncbi:MAG: cyclic nucleotide-binding domain-containing protein [Pseudodesulfovibrio sp.]|nr:cyclic nucleotide-binding domain-containing protein [Pseudodesulfovibrio sp.]